MPTNRGLITSASLKTGRMPNSLAPLARHCVEMVLCYGHASCPIGGGEASLGPLRRRASWPAQLGRHRTSPLGCHREFVNDVIEGALFLGQLQNTNQAMSTRSRQRAREIMHEYGKRAMSMGSMQPCNTMKLYAERAYAATGMKCAYHS